MADEKKVFARVGLALAALAFTSRRQRPAKNACDDRLQAAIPLPLSPIRFTANSIGICQIEGTTLGSAFPRSAAGA